MLTSPYFILPMHPHGDLVTVIIRLGFCFIIGQTHLPYGKTSSLITFILGLKGTQQVHPFLRYHGALILIIVVDIIFNFEGWAILDSLVNGLLFEEDLSLSPICVIEILNFLTRRGVEDNKNKHFTYTVRILYEGVGYSILNITGVVIRHTVVLLPNVLYNIKS